MVKREASQLSPILKRSSEPPTKRLGLRLVGFFLKKSEKKLVYVKKISYISTVIESES